MLELVSPEAYYKLLSGTIHPQCDSESLADIWLLEHNECSTRQTSICYSSLEARGVRGIESAAGHFEISFVSLKLKSACDSIKLDSDSFIPSPKGFRSD